MEQVADRGYGRICSGLRAGQRSALKSRVDSKSTAPL
jgi:hypothetical protein